MKLTNNDIFVAQEPLGKLVGHKLPVMVSYKLAKMVNTLDIHFRIIDGVRNNLVKKYGETGENGKVFVKEGTGNWDKFVTEFNELMAQEVELDIEKVKLPEKVSSTCEKCQHSMEKAFEIEPSVLIALDKFVEV